MSAEARLTTVVVATRNAEHWIRQALDASLRPDYPPIEIIAVDDHSSDSTLDILDAASKADARLTVVRAEDSGLGRALNLGVSLAGGANLAFAVDGDSETLVHLPSLVTGFHRQQTAVAIAVPRAIGNGSRMAERDARILSDRRLSNKLFSRASWNATGTTFADARYATQLVPLATMLSSFDEVETVRSNVPGMAAWSSIAALDEAMLSDYLHQEVSAISILRTQLDDSLFHDTVADILSASWWPHWERIVDLLSTDVFVPGAVPGLLDDVRRLVELLPATSLDDRTVRLRLSLLCVAASRPELTLRAIRADRARGASLLTVAEWQDVLGHTRSRSKRVRALRSGIFYEDLVAPLLEVAHQLDSSTLRTRVAELADLVASSNVTTVSSVGLVIETLAALRRNEWETIQLLSTLQATQPLVVTGWRSSRTSIRLRGTVGHLPDNVRVGFEAVRAEDQQCAIVANLLPANRATPTSSTWTQVIRRRSFPGAGTWRLRVAYSLNGSSILPRRIRAASDAQGDSAGRRARLDVRAGASHHRQIELVIRPTLVRRVFRRLARSAKPGA